MDGNGHWAINNAMVTILTEVRKQRYKSSILPDLK